MLGVMSLGSLLLLTVVCSSTHAQAPFGTRQVLGQLDPKSDLKESSGLAASRVHGDILYTHNDNGDRSRFFALNAVTGKMVAEFNVKDTENYDWEDMAIGPCVDDCHYAECGSNILPSRYCLYIADTGDHGGDGARNNIYMLREPLTLKDSSLDVVSTLKFSWPEPDAETIMVTPKAELFIVSKLKGVGAKIAKFPKWSWGFDRVALNMNEAATVKVVTTNNDPQGGDISHGGDEMLLVFEEALYYYKILNSSILSTVSDQTPEEVTSYTVEPSTEADAGGFYTLPEGGDATVAFYPRIADVVG